ncbi:hypothetical protein CAL26_09915 [Bordetella genomosp. 9]|uniref:Uncharacterized protein n=1 Tax=Bordetella genomosp. 9 TaxID=1416803 RepID=A0A261RG17_9BORD|nr:hypothetical protein [Bordetella genomosp. 9]OZI23737.1 hypothetical protein CAL26_09915 [Bordetella genomosp. 9]
MLYISNWNITPGSATDVTELRQGLACLIDAEAAAKAVFDFAEAHASRVACDKHYRAWQDLKELRLGLEHDVSILTGDA